MVWISRIVLILVSSFLLLQGSCSRKREFNILLITVDTLRADHLSTYGYHRITSPAIDRVAAEGTLFLQAMAQRGSTWTSVTSILTSMYPHTHGVRENGMELDSSIPTFPRLLKQYGYSTAAFVTNMTTSRHAGFDHVSRFRGLERDQPATNAAMKWLRENKTTKFLAWVHYLAPHKPYAPPAPYQQRFVHLNPADVERLNGRLDQITLNREQINEQELNQIVALYDAEIAYIDAQIGRLLQSLEDLDLSKNTLLIITADHGEELYERNYYFYHSCSIYDSVLRIPLIVRFPDRVPPGQPIRTVVESIDIAPTIFDLLSLPSAESFEGKSLMPLMKEGPESTPSVAYSEIKDKIFSIRTDRWRYILNPTSFRPDGEPFRGLTEEERGYIIAEEELYLHTQDPAEKQNRIRANPETAAKLKEQLLKWVRKSDRKIQSPEEADQETLEELKALGYIQ